MKNGCAKRFLRPQFRRKNSNNDQSLNYFGVFGWNLNVYDYIIILHEAMLQVFRGKYDLKFRFAQT